MRIDWSALTGPVDAAEVQAWKSAAQAAGHRWARGSVLAGLGSLLVLVPLAVAFGGLGFLLLSGSVFSILSGAGGLTLVVGGFTSLVCFAAAAFAVWTMTRFASGDRRWERWLRLDRFARANRMTFSPGDPNPNYPGAIFRLGGSPQALDHLRSVEGRFFDLGNFRYIVSSGKSSTAITWGFLALHLERRLPHMLLDSVANNSWASPGLSGVFARDQVLSLEGDVDRYFTLYCPREYETDALYVFTPDLLALCIDEVAPFDVEIVDDWLFVYSPRPFRMDDPRLLDRLFRIVDVVGTKALRRTGRYRDERAAVPFPADVVAPPGQRLRRRVPVAVFVVLGLVVVPPVLIAAGVMIATVVAVLGG